LAFQELDSLPKVSGDSLEEEELVETRAQSFTKNLMEYGQ